MRPITLKIKGINSFNKMQEINFNTLTEYGLFGIFGDTGAGKSSIIDCITLALYGEIARYHGLRENSNFLNINCDKGEVYFEFSVRYNKGEQVYRIIRKYKKINGKTSSDDVELSIIKNGQKEIIEDKSIIEMNSRIKEIIGLSYDDFTRAVVLPQGEFSKFLLLKGKEKREMLARLFLLEEYGDKLSESVNTEKADKKMI